MKSLNAGAFIHLSGLSAVMIIGLTLTSSPNVVVAQGHDMQNMPGMKMSKPKAKVSRKTTIRKKRVTTRKRRITKNHDMGNMAGMNMLGMKRSGVHRRRTASRRSKARAQENSTNQNQMSNMPRMTMPARPASPKQSASPQPSPQQIQMNMPGMQMPTASPNPQASPQQKMDMNMPMPSASPSASPMDQMPGMHMDKMNMNMGPLMVMNGNGLGIRVGSSDTNIMSMGSMGSGTSWQPSSGTMHMYHKAAGDWLLMFHYNLIAGVNRQGGPRGVTKAESANWFMPMAYHKLGKRHGSVARHV